MFTYWVPCGPIRSSSNSGGTGLPASIASIAAIRALALSMRLCWMPALWPAQPFSADAPPPTVPAASALPASIRNEPSSPAFGLGVRSVVLRVNPGGGGGVGVRRAFSVKPGGGAGFFLISAVGRGRGSGT
jgi:hypothetical protein